MSAVRPTGAIPHPQVYHVRCSNCRAITAHDVAADAMRTVCPSCRRRLTLPAEVRHKCDQCGTVSSYRHILAGHSCACGACGAPVVLPAMLGRAKVRHHPHRHRHARYSARTDRTPAFSDTAERSMILAVATVATIIFVIVFSLL